MTTYWTMPIQLVNIYSQELIKYHKTLLSGEHSLAWRHLERAHILGQPWTVQHTEVHWMMLKFGVRIKNWREIIGQIPRLFFGGIKSFVGTIPVGNTGGANVPPLLSMEIPEDLRKMLETYRPQ